MIACLSRCDFAGGNQLSFFGKLDLKKRSTSRLDLATFMIICYEEADRPSFCMLQRLEIRRDGTTVTSDDAEHIGSVRCEYFR